MPEGAHLQIDDGTESRTDRKGGHAMCAIEGNAKHDPETDA